MRDLPNIAPFGLGSVAIRASRRTMLSPLWRGVRSVGVGCIAATTEQHRTLLAATRRDSPLPVDEDSQAVDRTRLRITADLTPVAGRSAIAVTIRPTMAMDDAEGEWIGPTVVARDGEDFAALAERALDRALPWRGTRADFRITGETK